MSPVRRWTTVLVRLALAVPMMGCRNWSGVTEVCGTDDTEYDASLYLDGVWGLTKVGGSPIPNAGVAIPTSSDRLRAGTLEFRTKDIPQGSCDDPKKSNGTVIATYLIADANGRPKFPSKVQAGSFEIDHESGTLTLRALGHSVVAPRDEDTITLTADIPLFGRYVLTFER